MTTNNKPAFTLRDGSLKATIWKNFGEKGNFYSVNFGRTYTDAQGNFRDSDSFSGSELLRLAHLASKAYDHVAALREADDEESVAE
jgi:hypothetical protein